MKTIYKKGLVVLLAALTLVLSVFVYSERTEAAVMYNNAINATLNCSIGSSGYLQAVMSGTGIIGTSRISVELYVEKKVLLFFWKRVDIGYPDNLWTDYTTNNYYNRSFTTTLSSSGTYRVTVTYTFSGSGGPDDIITRTATSSY